jgi:hypothetical protein
MTAIVPINNVSQVEEAPAQSSAENDAENNPENDIEIQSQNDETRTKSGDDSLGHSSVHADPEAEASEADPASPLVTPMPACDATRPCPMPRRHLAPVPHLPAPTSLDLLRRVLMWVRLLHPWRKTLILHLL